MSMEYRFVQPIDTVSIRGNKLFGDSGSINEAQFPPNPSVLAGAFRSHLLTQVDDIQGFSKDQALSDPALAEVLGTPSHPGKFAVAGLWPATQSLNEKVEALMPLPADVWAEKDSLELHRLVPQALPAGVQAGQALPMLPVLRQDKQGKPDSGYLLNAQGIQAYQNARPLTQHHLIKSDALWLNESRVGIGIDMSRRTAEEGKLFTVDHTVLQQPENNKGKSAVGLLVALRGCGDTLSDSGFLRLGGDGRAATFSAVPPTEMALPLQTIKQREAFKIVLNTPGLFTQGWLPNGVKQKSGDYWLHGNGYRARLCCAALGRNAVVSGWDLARWQPKAAERVVPAGSVYWFDRFEGDVDALGKLASTGLWPEIAHDTPIKQRWAEGYNRILLAAY